MPETAEVLALADDGMRRVSALLRIGIEPDLAVSEAWCVRDVAVHLVTGLEFYTELAAGLPSELEAVTDVAAKNAALLTDADPALAELDLAGLSHRLEDTWSGFREAVLARPVDAEVVWHAGERLPIAALVGMMVGEAEVHGYDVAHVASAPWTISPEATVAALESLRPVLPLFLDTDAIGDFCGRFEMRIRSRPERLVMSIADGTLTVEDEAAGPVDCYVSARAHELMLVLYGRLGPIRPALTGRMVAYGRRPWLGLKLPGYFRSP